MEGTIVDFSDSGSTLRAFAVVEVTAKRTIVVPIGKLKQGKDLEAMNPTQ
jgi:hypothetical protein